MSHIQNRQNPFAVLRNMAVLAAALLIIGCAGAPAPVAQAPATPTPTPTGTPAPTDTPTPAPTPTPTATPTATPTSTPTPVPTATPTPRPTPTPTNTPAPTPQVTIPRGWSVIADERLGYSLAVPFGWLTFDLHSGDLDGIARLVGGAGATAQLEELLNSPGGENLGIVAVEPDVTQLFSRTPFPTVLTVSVAPFPDALTLERLVGYVEESASTLGQADLSDVQVTTINNLPGVQATGTADLSSRGLDVRVYLVATALRANQKAYILTIATRVENAGAKQPTIDQIIGTFRPE